MTRTWGAPGDLGTSAMGVPEGTELTLEADLLSIDDGVLVQLHTHVFMEGECVRCLDPVTVEHDVESAEVYVDQRLGRPVEDDADTQDDVFLIGQHDTIDLENQVRDAIVTLVDDRPLCRPDCRGLCDVCGEKWDDLPADHHHEMIDPRLASLANFFNNSDTNTDPQD